jgi:hypothetical protein
VQRGERANTPWVVSLLDKEGVALGNYVTRDTRQTPYSIQSPVGFESIKVRVSLDKVRKLRSVLPS